MSELESLGSELREARLHRELTPQQVEKKIHIRAKFIEALEQGRVDLLPSPVQARGFLRNYARFLSLDPDLVVARWDESLTGGGRRRRNRAQVYPPPTVTISTRDIPGLGDKKRSTQTSPMVMVPSEQYNGRRGPRLLIVFFAMLFLALLIGLGVMFYQVAQQAQRDALPDNRQPLTAILTPTDSAGLETPLPLPSPTRPRPSPLPNPGSPFQTTPTVTGLAVEIQVTMRSWLRVTVDDQEQYVGYPGPNTVLKYEGRQINIRTANAAGVRLTVNGREVGILGARGQIFDQTLTLNNLDVLFPPATTPTAETPFSTQPPVITALPTAPSFITPSAPETPTPPNPVIVTPGATS